jgi:hypothetical protein
MREEKTETAGFLACREMLHNYLAAARDDQFLVEQDPHETAAPMSGLLQNCDRHPATPRNLSHRVTDFVPEPGDAHWAATPIRVL